MSNHSILPLITEAERVLSEAIKHFGLTVKPEQLTVTIQTQGRSKAAGWFAWDRWQGSGTTLSQSSNGQPVPEPIPARHEINLSAECLHDNDMGMVLLHELAHAALFCEDGNAGVDKTCKKHNSKFKALAERLGLDCQEKDPKVMWGNTILGSVGRKFLEDIKFDRSLFELFRLPSEKADKATTRMLKLVCTGEDAEGKPCGYTIRTTQKHIEKGLPVCPCGESFEQVVKEEEED